MSRRSSSRGRAPLSSGHCLNGDSPGHSGDQRTVFFLKCFFPKLNIIFKLITLFLECKSMIHTKKPDSHRRFLVLFFICFNDTGGKKKRSNVPIGVVLVQP